MGDTVTSVQLDSYLDYLKRQERSLATIKQYQRDIQSFLMYIKKHGFCKESVIQYKEKLRKEYLPASVNVKLAEVGFQNDVRRDAWVGYSMQPGEFLFEVQDGA